LLAHHQDEFVEVSQLRECEERMLAWLTG
jgi:hypothetical protein